MELQQRVIDHFHQSLDLKVHVVESFAPQIAQAAEQLFNCLVAEHKVLCCGNGGSAALAQHFCALMLNRYQYERPGLPALALNADSATLSAIADDSHFSDVYSKQIRALGQPGDILLAISHDGRSASLIQAIQAAHDRGMTVITLSGDEGGDIAALLTTDEIEMRIPSTSIALVHEVHITIIHALCDLIEHQLFGGH